MYDLLKHQSEIDALIDGVVERFNGSAKEKFVLNEDYVSAHNHSENSYLDGAAKVDDLAEKAKSLNMPLILTDHGNVSGTVTAYSKCKSANIPFIRGMEAYISKGSDSNGDDEDYEGSYYHLILLPYTKEGFENINYLSSLGYVEGLKTVAGSPKPVIKKDWLENNSDGIVAMSACMYGEISANIWLSYPYLDLLKYTNEEYSCEFMRRARELAGDPASRAITKKSKIKVDDLSDLEVMKLVLQKKGLRSLKNELFDYANKQSNEVLIEVLERNEDFVKNTLSIIEYYINLYKFFYLEIQDHGFFEQRLTTVVQKYMVEKFSLPTKLVVTNDVHYVEKEDWEIQDTLLCISTGKQIDDPTRWKFEAHELYFKTKEDLMNRFQYLSESDRIAYLKNTVEVAKICMNYKMKLGEVYYPEFEIPDGFKDASEYMLYLTVMGFREKADKLDKNFRYRIFKIIDFEELRDMIYKNIDFKTALEWVKDMSKQAAIINLITPGIDKTAEDILDSSLRRINYNPNVKQRDRYYEAIRRIIYEFAIIVIKEIPDYFLIVRKIIQLSLEQNIPVGPGRGSCAGSAVAYGLDITGLDPIEYSLLFERFINPERNSYPDIDTDFSQRYLGKVRSITSEYFGVDNCCGVNAVGYLKDKKAVQDCYRVYGFSSTEYTAVSKSVTENGIKESVLDNKSFKLKYEENNGDNKFKKALDMACRVSGMIRQPGTHAAGLIITPRNMSMFRKLPVLSIVQKGKGTVKINSQYDKKAIEYAGFLKMDLLGLRTLDIISDAVNLIKEHRGMDLDISTIPLDDEKTYKMYQAGDTDFVFQVESSGMKNFLKQLKPTNLEDIIVVLAGYRPGPMGYLEDYVQIRDGKKEAVYRHPLIKPVLEVTGGIPFYQEQVMDVFVVLGGYSRGRADLVRRAMGKKDKAILDQEKHNFIYGIQAKDADGNDLFDENGKPIMEVNGCINNGIPEDVADAIYQDIIPFADYGFNKSHAAGYGLVSYQTGYLKANYFIEFATAVMRSVETNKKKLTSYANIVKEKNVQIIFPDINKSNKHMDIYDFKNNIISTGFMAIKGLSEGAIDNIIAERNLNGEFKSFEDFLDRMVEYNIDKKAVGALIGAGVFDAFTVNQELLTSIYENKLDYKKTVKALRSSAKGTQKSLYDFDDFCESLDYLREESDNNGYDVYNRLANLCEYNNVGIHGEILQSYSNIQHEFEVSRRQNDSEKIAKTGIVTGFLEEVFELSKSGKAYLGKMIGFDGERYKLILTKSKIEKILGNTEPSDYKKGMVLDIVGDFSFPNLELEDDNENDEDENAKPKSTEVAAFPKSIVIKTVSNPYVRKSVIIDLDEFIIDKNIVFGYFGVNNLEELIKNVLSKLVVDENTDSSLVRDITFKYLGREFKYKKKTYISMDMLKKLGCKYTMV